MNKEENGQEYLVVEKQSSGLYLEKRGYLRRNRILVELKRVDMRASPKKKSGG